MTRLSAAIEAGALIRAAEAEGGFGTVLHRGYDQGTLLILLRERGRSVGLLERSFNGDRYDWTATGPTNDADIPAWLDQRRRRDQDEWQIELDIADAKRFVAETIRST